MELFEQTKYNENKYYNSRFSFSYQLQQHPDLYFESFSVLTNQEEVKPLLMYQLNMLSDKER